MRNQKQDPHTKMWGNTRYFAALSKNEAGKLDRGLMTKFPCLIFFGTIHFFWTWALLMDFTTIRLEMATLLLDLHALLLHLALPQTTPLGVDSPAAFLPQFFRQ